MILPVVLPWIANWPMTRDALEDVCAQQLPEGGELQIFLVGNGVRPEEDLACRQYLKDKDDPRIAYYSPPMRLALSTIWNRTLQTCWEIGAEVAWVVNNDVRLWNETYQTLVGAQRATAALFVSGVGVTREQFVAFTDDPVINQDMRGGPDFSCFLLTKEMHTRFPFDEQFYPAYCEDLDMHRRLMLAGEGARIFGVNLPFHHIGSGSLKSLEGEERAATERRIGQAREYYQRKWGGPANQETFLVPFGAPLDGVACHITTPDLQRAGCTGVSCGQTA